jgi:hypothetical protein
MSVVSVEGEKLAFLQSLSPVFAGKEKLSAKILFKGDTATAAKKWSLFCGLLLPKECGGEPLFVQKGASVEIRKDLTSKKELVDLMDELKIKDHARVFEFAKAHLKKVATEGVSARSTAPKGLKNNEVEYNYYENGTRYIVNKSKPHWRVIKAEKDRLAALAAYNKTWKEGQKKTPVAPAKEGGRFTRKQRKTRLSRKTRKQRNNKHYSPTSLISCLQTGQ